MQDINYFKKILRLNRVTIGEYAKKHGIKPMVLYRITSGNCFGLYGDSKKAADLVDKTLKFEKPI